MLQKFDVLSKAEIKLIKTPFFDGKIQKPVEKECVNTKQHSLLWTCSTDLWCNMLQTLEIPRKYRWWEIISWMHSEGVTQNYFYSFNGHPSKWRGSTLSPKLVHVYDYSKLRVCSFGLLKLAINKMQ